MLADEAQVVSLLTDLYKHMYCTMPTPRSSCKVIVQLKRFRNGTHLTTGRFTVHDDMDIDISFNRARSIPDTDGLAISRLPVETWG